MTKESSRCDFIYGSCKYILAFFASVFFNTPGLFQSRGDPVGDSLRLTIGFGAANAVFSVIAYFVIEPPEDDEDDSTPGKKKLQLAKRLRGRRSLLMISLGGGTAMLFVLTFLLNLNESSPAKLPLVVTFIMLFTLFYSPGAGCVPFVYSAEVWPNDGRGMSYPTSSFLSSALFYASGRERLTPRVEVGMSWAVFWNFLGAGFLALFVPRGLQWGSSKLFGLFVGISFFGLILVFLFVRSTGHGMSLEDISLGFKRETTLTFSKERIEELAPPCINRPSSNENNSNGARGTETEPKEPERAVTRDPGQESETIGET
ncbi:hypothetical protein V8E54_010452 [Elaphomyces granulatus]